MHTFARPAMVTTYARNPTENPMNRRKKVNQILKKKAKKAKKANDKLNSNSKPRYVSKAERAKQEQQAGE
ncbi:DUF2986 domain-containing protein [Microbulbifer sp. MCCC 1A16149]|uniref:DUF2986 domain-containing protein n=1 Tax=Microbulbifer sp. MCCC 1A16149 TaxID=3411322 RepID=UPI003D0979DC